MSDLSVWGYFPHIFIEGNRYLLANFNNIALCRVYPHLDNKLTTNVESRGIYIYIYIYIYICVCVCVFILICAAHVVTASLVTFLLSLRL